MSDFSNIRQVVYLVLTRGTQERKLLVTVVLSIVATAAGAAVFPVFFSLGIDALTEGNKPTSAAAAYILAFGVGFTLVGVLEQIQWLTFGPLNLRLQRLLTTHVFRHAINLPYYRLKTYTTYEIGRTIEKGLDAVREITSNLTFFLIPTIIELSIAASVIAFMIDLWIAAFLLVALIAYGVLADTAASRIRRSTEDAMESGIEAWSFGLDGVANAELVQQSNFGDRFIHKLDEKLRKNDLAWATTFRQRTYFGSLQALVFGLVVTGVLWRGCVYAEEGSLSIGELVLLNTYIIRLLQPVETFARVYRDVHAALGEARLLADLLAVEVWEPEVAGPTTDRRPVVIELRDISIDIADHRIVSGLSFVVGPNEPLFIVGPSGVGKTSLLKLLSGLTMPSAGEFLVNGDVLTEKNAGRLRNDTAVVQQDCLLFDWSIRENIAFGYDGPQEHIDHVISALGLSEIIGRHEAHGETTVGERGNRLSGGEKQRISLARALLKRPALLLLDEATSALDEMNRKRAVAAIETLQRDSTCVFVTHDIALIKPESRVLFLQATGAAFSGRHAELLAGNPTYRRFIDGSEGQA